MRIHVSPFALPLLLLLPIKAQEVADPKVKPAASLDLPPLPAEARAKQTMTLGSRTLTYTVTVGAIPVLDEKGKKAAEVVCTSYVLEPSGGARRPVAFAFNGGPGSASAWLNLGAIGPKRVQFGTQGDGPSDPLVAADNAGTFLEFTDLVFIDPVGTGYSHSLVSLEDAKKRFYTMSSDIAYLSQIVYDWLARNDRMGSAKYLIGESYGGFRAPRIAQALLDLGIGVSGLVMVSPHLDGQAHHEANLSPLPWMGNLPTMAAAHLERQGKLTPEALVPVEGYATGEYVLDLMKGWSDPEALERIVQKVTAFTGLNPEFVRQRGGRISFDAYLKEELRAKGQVGSYFDASRTVFDPFPWSPEKEGVDPSRGDFPLLVSAMVDLMGRTLNWKPQGRYVLLSEEVGKNWESAAPELYYAQESGSDLKRLLVLNPRLKVLITHGFTDFSCPYLYTKLVLAQLPPMADPGRVRLKVYPGGHMFYNRPASQMAFLEDAKKVFAAK